jgi:hypothetical protein
MVTPSLWLIHLQAQEEYLKAVQNNFSQFSHHVKRQCWWTLDTYWGRSVSPHGWNANLLLWIPFLNKNRTVSKTRYASYLASYAAKGSSYAEWTNISTVLSLLRN